MFSTLRTLVFLRRIARALESIALSQSEQTRLLVAAEERRLARLTRAAAPAVCRPVEVGAFDPVEASRKWRREQIASGRWTEEELEDEYGPLPR